MGYALGLTPSDAPIALDELLHVPTEHLRPHALRIPEPWATLAR